MDDKKCSIYCNQCSRECCMSIKSSFSFTIYNTEIVYITFNKKKIVKTVTNFYGNYLYYTISTIITYLFALYITSLQNETTTGCNFLDMTSSEITLSLGPRNKSQLLSLPDI